MTHTVLATAWQFFASDVCNDYQMVSRWLRCFDQSIVAKPESQSSIILKCDLIAKLPSCFATMDFYKVPFMVCDSTTHIAGVLIHFAPVKAVALLRLVCS